MTRTRPRRLLDGRPTAIVGLVLFLVFGIVITVSGVAAAYLTVSVAYTTGSGGLATAATLLAPTSVSVAETSATSVSVNWTAPSGQPTGAQYEVTEGGATVVCSAPATSPCAIATLSPGDIYEFSVQAVEGTQWHSTPSSASFTTLAVTTTSLPTATVGASFSVSLSATGGVGPYYWSVSGALPSWATLTPDTGTISGVPTTAGTVGDLVFTVTDADTFSASSARLSLTIARATPTFTVATAHTSIVHGSTDVLSVSGLPSGATGTVAFTSGETTLCTATLSVATSCTTSDTLTAGTYPTITGRYTSTSGSYESATSSNHVALKVYGAPTITKITPDAGTASTAHAATITGTDFASTAAVYIGTTKVATVTVTSTTSITATLPSEVAGKYTVKVKTGGGTSAAKPFFYGAPTITKITPDAGTASTTHAATITGTDFASTAAVYVGTTKVATVTVTSTTSITATLPSEVAGKYTVKVKTGGGTSAAKPFFYGAPTITKITPDAGTASTAHAATITGTDFASTAAVYVGTTKVATVTVTSTTSITATLPSEVAGKYTVKVKTGGGTSAAKPFFYGAPTITKITPDAGTASTTHAATITGTDFASTAAVYIGTTKVATVTVTSTTSITATLPSEVAGKYTVKVKTGGGTSAAKPFFYGAPTITTVDGVTSGTDTVGTSTTLTIVGTRFGTTATVTLDSLTARTIKVVSTTEITFKIPSTLSTSTHYPVVVTTGGGSATSAARFDRDP